QQYDSMVQTNTVEGPGLEAGVVRIKGTNRALAMALDGNGRWCYLNPKLGAQHAVAEACRKVAITGATPVAATNNLNFGNPEKPPIMRQFSDAVDGIAEACTTLGTPITGGNVSLYNETLGEGIYPTPVLGIVGIIQDVAKAVTAHFTAPGHDVALLTARYSQDDDATFGSSEYAKEILGTVWGQPPALDLEQEAALQSCIITLVDAGLLHSAHDVADGGLAVTVAESCFQYSIGAQIDVPGTPDPALTLFGEAASRIVISCDSAHLANIENIAASHNLMVHRLGKTGGNSLEIRVNGETAIRASISELKSAWKDALVDALGVSATLEVTT
ncbi:MAG TPA: AIR synthase related protein, partial [Terriglobales bacterium]